jgi:molybdopterin biosynthesis enzyme
MVADSELQRIARLTPLADVLNGFQTSIAPVEPREEALADALGKTLGADVAIAQAIPARALALRDGFAVRAELTSDASSYAPALLTPKPMRVEMGEPLPQGTDSVAALDTITERSEATAAVAPGEGVLHAGGDAAPGVLRLAGARLRRVDVALLHVLGVGRVLVREPTVRVIRAAKGTFIEASADLIANAIDAEGGFAVRDESTLDAALKQARSAQGADAVVAIGGTGSGRNDASVTTLARLGRVEHHGIAIAPGETSAVGSAGVRPVLLLPGRLDAALAGWLTVGRRLLARLAFRMVEEQPFLAELSRKVASPLGLAEVVPVRRRFSQVEPLAGAYLSPQTLARADGWILVPADSEGYPEGTRVPVRPWP